MTMRKLTLATLALALVACGGGDTAAPPSPSPSPSPRPSSTATIRIVEPAEGATVEGPVVRVQVEIEGGRLIDRASTTLTPNTGHVHIALDGTTVTLLAGLTFEIKDVAPGRHLIAAEFAANDHGPFQPPVRDATTVTVT